MFSKIQPNLAVHLIWKSLPLILSTFSLSLRTSIYTNSALQTVVVKAQLNHKYLTYASRAKDMNYCSLA